MFLRYKKISKKTVKIGGFLQCSVSIFLGRGGCFWKINSRILSNHEELSNKAWLMWQQHISQNIFSWKLQWIIRPWHYWQQDSVLFTGPGISPQIYHRAQCPVVLICRANWFVLKATRVFPIPRWLIWAAKKFQFSVKTFPFSAENFQFSAQNFQFSAEKIQFNAKKNQFPAKKDQN